jgi:heme-degrading monooxygenase HmoA
MSTVKITKSDKYTFINVFTLHDKADQEKLIGIMSSVMSGPGKAVPGFVSAALHRSLDGTKVVVYSQWTSKEAGASLARIEELKPFAKQAMEIASMTPMMYEVAETFIGPDYK